jgi:signal transduction histidine kinase
MTGARTRNVTDALSLADGSAILEHIADAVTAQDASGRVVYANDAALRLLGYATRAELERDARLLRLEDYVLLDEAGAPLPQDRLPSRQVLAGAPAADATIRWRRRGTSEDRWTMVQSRPVMDEAGQVRLAINILHDVTERWRAVRRLGMLAEASAILTRLIDFDEMLRQLVRLPVPRRADWCLLDVLDGDRMRRFVVHADAAKAELVARLEEHPPRPDRFTLKNAVVPQAELVAELDDAALARHVPDRESFALCRALGARSLVVAPLAARGHALGALALVTATPGHFGSDDLHLAEDLAHAAALAVDNARVFRQAQRAAEVRKELVAVVAHDLKNPLNAIGMASALLTRHARTLPDGERIERQSAIITRAAERMDRLIHDLLDVAAIDAGALTMERQRVNVCLLINEAHDAMAQLAQDKQLILERELPSPELHVLGDRERLLQALSNLVGNAVKFTPSGGRVTLRALLAGEEVRFYVADTGPGIAPEDMVHLFDRFWRVRERRRDGTGLGLSIVKGIVEAHGGRVAVDTLVGRGASFHFSLPLAP